MYMWLFTVLKCKEKDIMLLYIKIDFQKLSKYTQVIHSRSNAPSFVFVTEYRKTTVNALFRCNIISHNTTVINSSVLNFTE